MIFPKKLKSLVEKRKAENNLRLLSLPPKNLVDFSSNDYLGFARNESLKAKVSKLAGTYEIKTLGSTGARLIAGNSRAHEDCEALAAKYHHAEKALLYNSGYDANVGLLSSVPQRGDVVLYDELSHASIIDGIRLSHATAYKFRHNDISHVSELLQRYKAADNKYVVTESVFSMDGDCAPLKELAIVCKNETAYLIVDEAHATGVLGREGRGLCNEAGIETDCFARVHTYGKAMGAHGAAIAGSKELVEYLVNFSRSFIFTTALPPSGVLTIMAAYEVLKEENYQLLLQEKISLFNSLTKDIKEKIESRSAIHCFVMGGNERVINASAKLKEKGFDVRAIKSPTVKAGSERLRVCLHAFNTEKEIRLLAQELIHVIAKR